MVSESIFSKIYRLNTRVMELFHDGQYEEALNIALQARDLSLQYLQEEHLYFIMNLHDLASIYKMMGKYEKAEPLMRQAFEISQKVFDEGDPELVKILDNLVELYKDMGKYEEAESWMCKETEIRRNVLGENHPDFAISLNNLGALYIDMGKFDEAESVCLQAMEIRRNVFGENHPAFATSLNNLAVLYREMGKSEKAEPLCRQAMEIRRRVLGENHPDYVISVNNLGLLYQDMGRYDQAAHFYHEAMELHKHNLGKDDSSYATSLNNLAYLYYLMGNYKEAEPLFHQSIEAWTRAKGESHPDCAPAMQNLALLLEKTGRWLDAIPLYRQAAEIYRNCYGENHPGYSTALHNLAGLYESIGNYDEAEELSKQVIEIDRNTIGEAHPDFALNLNVLALTYDKKGEYEKAESLYRQALTLLETTVGRNHPDYSSVLSNLASLCVATDRKEEAYILLQEALAIDNQMIGQVFSFGSEEQRLAYLKTVQSRLYRLLSFVNRYRSDSLETIRFAFEQVLRRKGITAEVLAIQRDAIHSGKHPEMKEKLAELKTLRMEIAQKTLAGPCGEDPANHSELLTRLTHRRESLETELAHHIPEMNLERKLREVDLQLISSLIPDGTILVEFVRFFEFDFKAVTARKELGWKLARYLAFVLPAGEPDNVRMVDLGEAVPIDTMIAAFRTSVIQEGERNIVVSPKPQPIPGPQPISVNKDGPVLRERLFDQVLDSSKGCKWVFLAPDGDLTRLPFEILPLDNERRLIDEYHISYLGTGRDILRFGQASTKQPAAPLVIADPDFDLEGEPDHEQQKVQNKETSPLNHQSENGVVVSLADYRKRKADPQKPPEKELTKPLSRTMSVRSALNIYFPRLKGSRVEGEHIGNMLEVQPWFREKALEATLKKYCSPRILHLATHGFFLEDQTRDLYEERRRFGVMGLKGFAEKGLKEGTSLENPLLRSGLALAGANTFLKEGTLPSEAEDGLLTAEDVTGLDLLDTDLVVLSACQAGLGKVHDGEGVFGLQRSFVIAGAKTLVMSLWQVPDKQTQELMEEFYRRLLDGELRSEALRNAQLSIKARYPHPFYWGAFICQGDPSPLPSKNLKEFSGKIVIPEAIEQANQKDGAQLSIVNKSVKETEITRTIKPDKLKRSVLSPLLKFFVRKRAIIKAAEKGNLRKVKSLLARGADIDAQDEYGFTALFRAIARGQLYGDIEIVKLLLQAGADVNIANVHGMTPLLFAIYLSVDQTGIVKLLLEHGADPSKTCNLNRNALDWAREMRCPSVEEVIKNFTTTLDDRRICPFCNETLDKETLPASTEKMDLLIWANITTMFYCDACQTRVCGKCLLKASMLTFPSLLVCPKCGQEVHPISV